MSKIGKKTIDIPESVKIEIEKNKINFQNAQGESLSLEIPTGILPLIKEKTLSFTADKKSRRARISWGTTRALSANIIHGLSQGFSKTLEIEGIGYRVEKEGENLTFKLGFSHPIKFCLPQGVKAEIVKNTIILSGIDKFLVGKTAATIRSFRKPEPYKGKGIRYKGEIIRKKAGKKAETGSGSGKKSG